MKNGKLIQTILNEYQEKREESERNAVSMLNTALKNNEYNNLAKKIDSLKFEIIEAESYNQNTDNLKCELKKSQENENHILKLIGLAKENLKPKYDCKLCNDTGFYNNTYCKCLKREYYKRILDFWDIDTAPTFTFKQNNFKIIKNDNQLKMLKALYKSFNLYCKKYPNVKKRNALFMGGTGVGKTCLLSSIYNELLSRDYNAIYITALQLNKLMLSYHLAPIAERSIYMADLFDVDFLFIDDLGTEQKLKNVTEEYLLQILNTRGNLKKPVFLSTNLNIVELKNSYNERLFSRMVNKKTTIIKEIPGYDLRLI